MRTSVVIPAFNAEHTLPATLRSVARQTMAPLEVIVVDDGSTDRTPDIARAHGATVITKRNGGLSAARNTGLANARGDWITFLDADDLLLPHYLQEMHDLQFSSAAALLYTTAYLFTGRTVWRQTGHTPPAGRYLSAPTMFRELAARNFVFVAATIRRDALQVAGGFHDRLNGVADWEMWLRLSAHGFDSARTHRPQGMYRHSAGQMSSDRDRMENDIRRMWAIIAAQHPLDDDLQAVVADRREFWEARVTPPAHPPVSAARRLARRARHARLLVPRDVRRTMRPWPATTLQPGLPVAELDRDRDKVDIRVRA